MLESAVIIMLAYKASVRALPPYVPVSFAMIVRGHGSFAVCWAV